MQYSLTNPRPDPGNPRVVRQQTSAPRADLPGAILPATGPRRTVEYQQTNPTFNANVLVLPYGDALERFLSEGDVIFVNHGGVSTTRGAMTNRRMPAVESPNLQMLNTLLARDDKTAAECEEFVKNYSFFGIMHNAMQLNGGTRDRGMPRRAERLLAVSVRGRSARTRNLWANSTALDVVGFALMTVMTKEEAKDEDNTWDPVDFKPSYVACDENGQILSRSAIVKSVLKNINVTVPGTGRPENLLRLLQTPPDTPEKRRAYHKYETEALEALSRVEENRSLIVPVNFTRADVASKADLARLVHKGLAWHVGVISDCFHTPASSQADVTPALTLLDQRLGQTRGVPQCELFIRVA